MNYFYRSRELIVIVLFLLVNISLSVNCLFLGITSHFAEKARQENDAKDNPFPTNSQSQNYSFIEEINLDSDNPIVIRFKIKHENDICLQIEDSISNYETKDLFTCKNENYSNQNYSLWVTRESKEDFFEHLNNDEEVFISYHAPNELLFLRNNRTTLETYKIDEKKRSNYN